MTNAQSPEMRSAAGGRTAGATRRIVGTGLVVGLLTLTNTFAYASFLASGPNAVLLPMILASALLSSALTSCVLARYHSVPSALGGPAGNAAAVVGAALGAVLTHESNAHSRPADTAVVLALTAILPGLAMLILARLRLARAIRFMPFPVVAGFFAGTGWLLVSGSLRIADTPGPIAASVAFVVLLRIAQQRWNSPLLIPAGVFCTTVVIHIGLVVAHVSLEAARATHWLYAGMPISGPVFLTPAAIVHADWGAIANAWSVFAWVVIVIVLVSLMNGAALEVESGADSDVNRDMSAVGVANLLTGLCGGFGSQLVLPTSSLALKSAPGSRLPAYIVSALAVAAIVGATSIIPFLPRPVFAGLIAFLGLRLLEQYVLGGIRTMPRSESVAVIAMLLCTALAGLQPALILGSIIACITFTANAGRQRVVRSRLTLRHARSRIERDSRQRRILEHEGDCVELLRLEGQLFFGSAYALYEALKLVIDDDARREAIIIDLAEVRGIDVSAALSFEKVVRRARHRGMAIIFANIAPMLEQSLRTCGAIAPTEVAYRHLDDAVAACELRILGRTGSSIVPDVIGGSLDGDALDSSRALQLYFEQIELAAGETLFSQGERADALYFVVDGSLSVVRSDVCVRTVSAGALVGEVAFLTGDVRSATVTALETAIVRRLSSGALRCMERDDPQLLAAFQRGIMCLQADRGRSAEAELVLLYE